MEDEIFLNKTSLVLIQKQGVNINSNSQIAFEVYKNTNQKSNKITPPLLKNQKVLLFLTRLKQFFLNHQGEAEGYKLLLGP